MDKLVNYTLYFSAVFNIAIIIIGAIVAYFTVILKMDHNLQLRNAVFRVIISFLLATATISVFSQLIPVLMATMQLYENSSILFIFKILNIVLYLCIATAYYWGCKNISMSFGYSYKQYQIIKLMAAFLIGWIVRDVLQLIIFIVLFFINVLLDVPV